MNYLVSYWRVEVDRVKGLLDFVPGVIRSGALCPVCGMSVVGAWGAPPRHVLQFATNREIRVSLQCAAGACEKKNAPLTNVLLLTPRATEYQR